MNTKDFIKLEDEVKQLLIDYEAARNDDMYLYYVYCCKKTSEPIESVLSDKEIRQYAEIRTFGTVERCRRKIQAECPELASERVKKARAKKEEEFKEYARL